MSVEAIGWIAVRTQRGQTMNGSRSVRYRSISNEILPAPSTTAARSSTTGTPRDASAVPTSWRLDEMLGLGVMAKAAEVHDASEARRCRSSPEAFSQLLVTSAKVFVAERVHEIERDLAPGQSASVGPPRRPRQPNVLGAGDFGSATRECDDIVVGLDESNR